MAHCRSGRVARRSVHWLRRPGGLPRGAYRRQYRAACCCLASFWEPPVSVHSSRALRHLAWAGSTWAGFTSRLERPLEELVPAPVLRECDDCAWRSWLGGAIGLIPWTVFLVITLPANYVALGFDVLLVAFMVTTAVLVFLRRQLVQRAQNQFSTTGRRHAAYIGEWGVDSSDAKRRVFYW